MKKYKENLKTKILETYSNLLYSVEYVGERMQLL